MRSLRVVFPVLLVSGTLLTGAMAAFGQVPGGFAGDPDADLPPPEAPLPPPPPRLPVAPPTPVVLAPDARDLLGACREPTFTDCFRLWEPPPPPPPPPPPAAAAPPAPGTPRQPAEPGGLTGGTPPAPDPAADRATYDALVRAIRDAGLDGKILLPEPPADGNALMKLNPSASPNANKAVPRP
ncbi:hypothetical protein [Azospirillum halopraeferens]|uniref:hypothetical protein n=1 Tax=Azospirillum halopraeferens TaxID=34010 RepID=UPI0004225C90|nr:hypothetical protein [Azospirillum halopraeferens]